MWNALFLPIVLLLIGVANKLLALVCRYGRKLEVYRPRHEIVGAYAALTNTLITIIAVIFAWVTITNDRQNYQTNNTLQNIEPLRQDRFEYALWNLAAFIQCHERTHGFEVSYKPFEELFFESRAAKDNLTV
jgi:hypothetical protein